MCRGQGRGQWQDPQWSRDVRGESPADGWGKKVPGTGIGECRSLKEKHAWHLNEATYAGSLAWNPGAPQMPSPIEGTPRMCPFP